MSVDIGVAEGHIILDTSGFVAPLQTAQRDVRNFASDVALQIGGAMQTLGNTIANIGNTITKYISAPLQDFAKSAFSEMAEFEDGMNRAGVIAGASAEEMAALTEKAKEMGRTTKFTATQASEAYQYMGMAGWKSQQMLEGLPGIMYLAAASGEDLASVSDIVTDALTAFKYEAKDSAHFADVLTAVTLNSNTTVGMLGEAFKYCAANAGILGYSVEDVGVVLGIAANNGIKASQAGTALGTSLLRMSHAPGQVANAMEEMGLSMYNADGSAKDLITYVREMREAFRGLDTQTKIVNLGVITGARGMKLWAGVITATDKEFEDFIGILERCDGKAKETADLMLNDLLGAWELLKSAISGFKLQFAEDILPLFTGIVRRITSFVASISELDSGARKAVLAFVAFGAAIGPLVASFGGVVTLLGGAVVSVGFLVSSIGTLSAAVGISAAAFAGWGAAILAGIAAIAGVIATFTAAFVDLMANNEEFYNEFMSVIDDIKQAFFDLKAEFDKALEDMGASNLSFTEALSMAWIVIKNAIAPVLLWFVESIRNAFDYVVTIVRGFLQVFDGIILLLKGDIEGGLTAILAGLTGIIKSFFVNLVQMAITQVKAIVGIFQSIGKSEEEITRSAQKVDNVFTETAKQREEYKNKAIKNEKELTKETIEERERRLEGILEAYKETGTKTEAEDKFIQEKWEEQNEQHLNRFENTAKQLPGIIADQREPMRIEADKIGTDLITEGDIAGAGYVGIMDAHLSHLEGIFNDYLSDALDVVDDFADSFQESGTNSAETFSNAIITELQKLPGNFTTQLNAVLTTTKTWSANMAKEALNMATTFNANAAKTAADLSAKLNNNLNASLSTASSWVVKMGKKGAEGAKLFLSYMLDAVDAQGAEIEKFGKDIAEHLTVGIENHSEWIKERLKPAYYKIIDEMEAEMGITGKKGGSSASKTANVAYAGDYSLGYGTIAGTTAQRTASAAAVQTTANTINFYSPKAIDEVEASRLLRKTQQDMLLGF